MKTFINFKNIAAIALLAVTSVVGFSAFTQDHVAKTNQVNYYWYDPSTGDLLSETPSENSPNGCIQTTGTECARGFLAQTDHPQSDTPAKIVYFQ